MANERLRWCARWAWVTLLIVGAAKPPPLIAQACVASSNGVWKNTPFVAQRDSFVVEYDDTPNAAGLDVHTGVAARPAQAYNQMAIITRFNSVNRIDAYDGTGYTSATRVAYLPGTRYHFRIIVRVSTHTFTAFVTPAGGAEVLLGQDFKFRSGQDTVGALGYWTVYASSGGGHTVCNWTMVPFNVVQPPPPPPLVTFAATVVPGSLSPRVGASHPFYFVIDSAGVLLSTQAAVWTSSDTSVVQITQSGTGTFLKAGTATVTARVDSLSASSVITVIGLPAPVMFRAKGLQLENFGMPLFTGSFQALFTDSLSRPTGYRLSCTVGP